MHVSLIKLLAIPLGCQKAAAKWLVISLTLSRWKAPLLNPLPQAGEEANEKSIFKFLRAREQTSRYVSFPQPIATLVSRALRP
jgi:hypothetical protein